MDVYAGYLSNEQIHPRGLGYIGDGYTTNINHYKDPGSLLNNQYFMESIRPFFLGGSFVSKSSFIMM